MTDVTFMQHHRSAEESLFSHLKRTPAAAGALTLARGHFSTPERANLYEIIRDLTQRVGSFDARMVHTESQNRNLDLEKEWPGTFSHVKSGDPSDYNIVAHYERQLKDHRLRTEYIAWMEQQRQLPQDLSVKMEAVVQAHAAQVARVQEGLTADVDPSAEGLVFRALNSPPNPYFPSGLEGIDQYVGGLMRGEQWVFSGPPGGRKTTVALNIVATQLRAGKSVMYIALEDNDEGFLYKLAAIWSGIPHREVRAHVTVPGAKPTEKVLEALEEIRQTKLRIYDAKKKVHNWKNLEPLVAGDKLRFGDIDLLVIDYVQAWTTSYEVLTDIVPHLLALVNEQKIAMIALSQMSNESIKYQAQGQSGGVPGVLATKGTGDLGSTCHVGIEIARNIENEDELTLTIKKARNGEGGKQAFVKMDKKSGRFLSCGTQPVYPEHSQMTPTERKALADES